MLVIHSDWSMVCLITRLLSSILLLVGIVLVLESQSTVSLY